LMNKQSKGHFIFCGLQRIRITLLTGERNPAIRYKVCCNGTACDRGRAFLIIPRISDVAESPPASFLKSPSI
jgi:hypothetical protein